MNILVTGFAGFIGSHLCENLLTSGHAVWGIDNFNDFYNPELKKQNQASIELVATQKGSFFKGLAGDITHPDTVMALCSQNKIDMIVHLAAMAGVRPSIEQPLLYEQVNGYGTLLLLEAAHKAGIKKFVFGSSSSVYGLNTKTPFSETDPVDLPFSPYAQTKRANELLCHVYHKLYGMTIAALRFFTVYGPRQRPDLAIRKFTDLIVNKKPIPIYGDGSFRRDFTYVNDIIDGVVKSIDWVDRQKNPQFEIFNLGESQTTSVNTLIELIEKALGLKAQRHYLPQAPGDIPTTFADITKAKSILDYNPQTSLEKGIPQFINWYKKTQGYH